MKRKRPPPIGGRQRRTIEVTDEVTSEIEEWVRQAKEGRRDALEKLVRGIQDRVYGLSLRMLGHPADAEDASQEILIKVITHLDGFREESAFSTWVYRIAANHLLTTRKGRMKRFKLDFELYESHVSKEGEDGRVASGSTPDQALLVEEVRASCMQGLLQCLGRELRLAFILGQVFEVTSDEGAYILGITPAAFRKRLSRGRDGIRRFLTRNCGLMKPENPCSCARQATHDIEVGWIDPEQLLYADSRTFVRRDDEIRDRLRELDEMGRVAALLRGYPERGPSESFVTLVKELLDSGRYRLLAD
jgi:RNA polymerase sigma factor (sigma-70 family)